MIKFSINQSENQTPSQTESFEELKDFKLFLRFQLVEANSEVQIQSNSVYKVKR